MGPIFDTVYCPDPELRADRLVSPAGPAGTASLAGIAPALVVMGVKDIVRDEAARYAHRLAAANALVEHLDLADVGHGFSILGAPRELVVAMYDRIVTATVDAVG